MVHFTGQDDEESLLNGCCVPDNFIQCFADSPRRLKQFLEAMLKYRAQCDTIVWNTTLELLLRKDLLREELREKRGDPKNPKNAKNAKNEQIEQNEKENENEKEKISDENDENGENENEMNENDAIDEKELEAIYRENIMGLLRMPKAQYDVDQALVLVQMHNFEEGQLFLYERLQMHEMMLKLYINAGDVEHAIQLCKEHKTEDSSLWTQLLIIYSEMDSLDTEKLIEVLNYVHENRIISPLLALQLVSKNPKITLGGMRNFLIHCIEGKRQMIEEDRSKVTELRKDVENMEAEMEDIKTYLFLEWQNS